MNHLVVGFVSVALLLAVVALARERRLRLASQLILQRLIQTWRSNQNTQVCRHCDDRNSGSDVTGCDETQRLAEQA